MNWEIDFGREQASFDRIANQLLNHHIINKSSASYRITEIEFYYKSGTHDDSFTYQDELQKESGLWFVHWSGIDITIGNGKAYGGILLRGLLRLDNGIDPEDKDLFIDGPLKVQSELLKMKLRVQGDSQFSLALISWDQIPFETIYRGPRIGLSKMDQGKNEDFRTASYRYIIFNEPKHQFKDKSKFIKVDIYN